MADLLIFQWQPDYGAECDVTPSVLTAQFGDGYSQDIAVGLNSTAQSWILSFNRKPQEADAIFNFIQNMGGVTRFWWLPPRQTSAIKVKTMGKYSKFETDAGQVTIQVTFQQVFDPD